MLKGLGGLGDMAKIMKQAQEMQGKMLTHKQRWRISKLRVKLAQAW